MIGILDSGLGGLSVLNEIHRILPQYSLHYIADSAWCPYGSKSYEQIQERVTLLVDYLISQGAEIIVIACNSATIACVEYLRAIYPLPIVGMVPGVKPAVKLSQNGIIGVFATEASLAGEKFHRLVSTHAHDVQVITHPCPDFVTLVEAGQLEGNNTDEAIHRYMQPMTEADTIVLGCTHYPFLKKRIASLYPHKQLVDTGEAVAEQVERRLDTIAPTKATFTFQTSGDPAQATQALSTLCPAIPTSAFSPFEEST